MTRQREYWCWTCLDFEYLPGIGPCPDCQPDAYTEYVLAYLNKRLDDAEGVAA